MSTTTTVGRLTLIFLLGFDSVSSAGLFSRAKTCENLLSAMSAEDLQTWSELHEDAMTMLFVEPRTPRLDAALKTAREGVDSLDAISNDTSAIERLVKKDIAGILSASRKHLGADDSEGFEWTYTKYGARVMLWADARKSVLERVFAEADLVRAWPGDENRVLMGNIIRVSRADVLDLARRGLRTSDIRRGVDLGFQIGPARFELVADRGDSTTITIEDVKEMPFNELIREDLDGQRIGITLEDMFASMKTYYPDLTMTDVITVLRFRRR